MTVHNNSYVLSVGESDLERMTLLGDIYMPYCADFLIANGLKPGLTVADVGCGPGNVSLWLAEQVGANGKVLGIDNSNEQLAILNKRRLEKELHHLSTYQCDIYNIDQIEQRFDIIFCRFLFIHLTQPFIALQKLRALLKPGGCLILAELDNSTWFSYPEDQALQLDTQLLCKIGEIKGADFRMGPKLYGYMRQEHFKNVNVNIAVPTLFGKHRDYLILKSIAWHEIYLAHGLLTEDQWQNWMKGMQALANNQDYLLAGAKMYLTCGWK